MSNESTLFKNSIQPYTPHRHVGQFNVVESVTGNLRQGKPACRFSFCTGGSSNVLADIAPATSSTTQLISALDCPPGFRPYLTRLEIQLLGPIGWTATSPTSNPYVAITDTSADGTPGVVIPWTSLPGKAGLAFPDSNTYAPMYVGPAGVASPLGAAPLTTFTYAAGVVTLGSDLFTSLTSETQMKGTPVKIIAGAGVGQTAQITACASGAFTLSVNWGTDNGTVAPDTTTSIIAIYWQPIQTATSTTAQILENLAGTPYTQNILDGMWFNVMAGTVAPQSRQVIANSIAGSCTLNGALHTNTAVTSALVSLSSNSSYGGAIDMVTLDKQACFAINTGIQCVVSSAAGTTPLGSNARIYGEGYWGP